MQSKNTNNSFNIESYKKLEDQELTSTNIIIHNKRIKPITNNHVSL